MALRIGFKIHRYLGQNKFKFLLNEPTRPYSSKPKYVIHPVRRLKSSSHTNFAPRKYGNTKTMALSYRDRDLQVSEYEMDAFENDLQPSAMPEYFTSTLESNLANFPEKSDLVRGRFAKSSTQSALTVPLKMPRLANPFPERLKSFPSDTMADDEKAKLMEDEMKMAARYNLQQSQQQQPEHSSYQPPAALQYHEAEVGWRESADELQLQPPADVEETLMQSRRPQARPRPRARAARYLKPSRHGRPANQQQQQQQQQRRFSSVCGSPAALTDLEQCDVILDRLRAQYPEYRALKKPLFVPGSREEREFIESTLRCIAKHKQDAAAADDDAAVKRAAAPFPSYSEVKTYVRAPRIRETKVSSSSSAAAQALGAERSCSRGQLTRSYSTTPSRQRSAAAAAVLSETRPGSDHGLQELVAQAQVLEEHPAEDQQVRGTGSSTTWRTMEKPSSSSSSSRRFSTRPNMCKKDKKKEKPTCKTMKSPGCADPNPNKCEYVYEKTTCKKLEAPYPSYSECMGDQYEEEPSECKICPWKLPGRHAQQQKTSGGEGASSGGKKKYSTLAAAAATAEQMAAHRKKPACENPFTDKKPCDFERAAQKQDEKRRKRPNKPSSKPQQSQQPPASSKKSFSTLATPSKHSFHTFSKAGRLQHAAASTQSSSSAAAAADNKTIVDRIRGWLNSWRPGSDNIRITQSADLSAGRETYIIEIQDIVHEQLPRPEAAPWISAESLRPAAVHHVAAHVGAVAGASGYACGESSSAGGSGGGKKSGKVGSGCPPPKKKETVSEDKKKCRQRKKRKLPSCHDVGRDKSKKDALNYSSTIQVTDDLSGGAHAATATSSTGSLSQQTREINALKEPKGTENVPFQLKPQFWRV